MNKDHYALKDMLNQRAKRKRENQNMCKMEKETTFVFWLVLFLLAVYVMWVPR